MSASQTHGHAAAHDHQDDHGPAKGIMRWLTTTNHKDIGTMYLVFSLIMFFTGGAMALVIRAELFMPGMQLVDPQFFNTMTTVHALIMVFGAVMPATVGLANWMIPLQIGAPDMALPRMNNFSFWLLVAAFSLLILSLFMPGGGPAAGWTLYPPLVLQTGDAFPLAIFAIHLAGASSIMGAINIIVTIMNLRAPGMGLLKMPLFVWTWLITAYLLIAVMPVFAGAVTMLLTDHFFHTTFFAAAGGGDPVLYQHIFWFFGHPEVYIMILPAFGIVSEIIPTFSRKKLFGYDAMVYATASIGFLSFIVWAHHMFTVGMPLAGQMFFMLSTMLIAVPTGVKVFNWTATMWKGSLTFEPPMLFALAFLFLFTIGGFSGYFGGTLDLATQRVIEFVRSIPTLPLWMALSVALPKDWSVIQVYFAIVVILSLVGWTGLARVVRGKFMALRSEDFVMAARISGSSEARIIFRHMLPSFTSHIIASLTLSVPGMILGETSLSFIGLGLQAPAISWGVLLKDAQHIRVLAKAPWLLALPDRRMQ